MPTEVPQIQQTAKAQLCATCGQQFQAIFVTAPGLGCYFSQLHCPPCQAKLRAEQEAAERTREAEARRKAWAELCPVEFRANDEGGETDPNRLRLEQPKFSEALRWRFGKTGLLLIGPSGTCKTRVAWRILRREFEAGRRVVAMKAHGFGVECQERRTSKGGFADWYRHLVRVPLLFIDDLGKGRFTDDAESHFFGLIDERTENGRPMIITSNSTGTALKARMSEDRGEPIIRRLRDYCQTVVFDR